MRQRYVNSLSCTMKNEKRVQKFRSIEEMNEAPIRRGDFESFLRHCARWWAIAPKRYPRGVFKFRSIEEAQEARRHHQTVSPLEVGNKQ